MWSDFESNVVEGRYPLGKLVRSEGRCGWFETQFEDKPAIISLIESLNDEKTLLERLRAVEKISDPNVVAIYETAATRLRATPLVYVVMEQTEENLEDILRERTLSAEETKQVADGLVNALRAIHKEHLVCGRLEAASVLASGDTIKLRSDYLQLVPQDAAFEPVAVKDLRDLGSLLHQCLTQRPLKRASDGNDPSLQLLPAPFIQIVRRTLTGGATLDEIAAILHPPATIIPTPSPAKSPGKSTVPDKPIKPDRTSEPESQSAPLKTPLKIGSAIVLLLLAGFAVWEMVHHADSSKDAPTQSPVVVVSPQTAPRRKPAAPPPQAVAQPAPVAPAIPSHKDMWRVVAFTYNYQDQAEHKAHTINEAHPDLQASVFSPKGSGAPYLVTLGAATDRASAFQVRDKAIQEGLPKDTYAQNYSH